MEPVTVLYRSAGGVLCGGLLQRLNIYLTVLASHSILDLTADGDEDIAALPDVCNILREQLGLGLPQPEVPTPLMEVDVHTCQPDCKKCLIKFKYALEDMLSRMRHGQLGIELCFNCYQGGRFSFRRECNLH